MTFAPDTTLVTASVRNGGPMLYVSLLVEALRARPVFLFWLAALSQAFVWVLVPAVFYAAPPGDVPLLLAVGREWQFGSLYGPPLAYWMAEAAFTLFGRHVLGVYVLSQACIVLTYWAVYSLARSIVGTAHALMAVLLMVGVIAFSVPTPEFGPNVLATPLSALVMLHVWRALGENRPVYWYVAGVEVGLLLLTTYAGLLLLVLVLVFMLVTARGRAALATPHPWVTGLLAVLAVAPHLLWLDGIEASPLPSLADLPDLRLAAGRHAAMLRLFAWFLVAHAGVVVLIAVAGGFRIGARPPAPLFERKRVAPLARRYVYFFALAPAACIMVLAVLSERTIPLSSAAPLAPLTALAVIIAAGDSIRLHRQGSLGIAWLALLLIPALATAAGSIFLPWIAATDLAIGRPASAMGQFFTDSFRRRTGRPLGVVVGDLRIGAVVALASADRPHYYSDTARERTPWLTDDEVRRRGAVLVWQVADPSGAPPAALKARFPEMVAEVPRAFERQIQGRLPLLRIGWAIIRPADQPALERDIRGSQQAQ